MMAWYDWCMSYVATSVRINGDAADALSGLATKLGQPKAKVIELALRELSDKVFWEDVQRAFEAAAADPEESARQKAEIRLWDRASDADFGDETW
jgi:predicted transcriptional regulator